MYYPDDVIERVRMENDIVDVISGYTQLKPKGNSHFGLCPFHKENTPSFSVSADKQLYYCFGCGVSGNVISFIMQKENLDYPEAIRHLAERARITLPEKEYSPEAMKIAQEKKDLVELHKIAAKFFHENLTGEKGKAATEYLFNRGINPKTCIKYGLGYSLDQWDSLSRHLLSMGYKDGLLLKSGLVTKSNKNGNLYDKFRDRLMFPIFDVGGNVIGFGGRIISNGEPKYLNSPETIIFEKSRNIYSLNFARKLRTKELILVEGYMDVISLYQAGIENAVASLGTAFNQNHGNIMRKYADSVVILFDSDDAGEKAVTRAIPVLTGSGIRVRVLRLEGAKDPDEFISKFGKAQFEKALASAISHVAFNIKMMEKDYDLNSDIGKIDFTTAAAKLLAKLPSEIERDVYISETSKITGISESSIKAEVLKTGQTAGKVNSQIRRNFDLGIKNKLSQKGLIDAKKSIILYAASDSRFAGALKDVLRPEEMADMVYSKLLKIIFDCHGSSNTIYPAELVNYFEAIEEQKQVSDIFITTITPEDTKGQIKALNDQLKVVKKAYIDNEINIAADMSEVNLLIVEKRNIEKLYISV